MNRMARNDGLLNIFYYIIMHIRIGETMGSVAPARLSPLVQGVSYLCLDNPLYTNCICVPLG